MKNKIEKIEATAEEIAEAIFAVADNDCQEDTEQKEDEHEKPNQET